MRFGCSRQASRTIEIELTPMIDVVFLLIIFFMVAAQFARITRAELDLPQEKGEQEQAAEEAGLVINLLADGSIEVAQRTIGIEELLQIVQEEIDRLPSGDPRNVKLLIRADRNNDTATLNDLFNRLRSLGVGAARLATEVPR
ncbi:MAG: biopolymer transporter ExbD [Planctomycetes bacterium]|nr:biopolymer transporter ExbD [Planctomycetota bacterium]MCH7601850.1 biopolymer transporter ExbD [Planctomycetota bacterium]